MAAEVRPEEPIGGVHTAEVAVVDNVFDDEDVSPLDIAAHVHDQAHRAALTARTVTRHSDKLDRTWNRHASGQVGKKNKCALENADQHDIAFVRIVRRDLLGQLANPLVDIGFRN